MSEHKEWETVVVLPMRIQTEDFAPDVHRGHWNLVEHAAENHRDVVIQLGVPQTFEAEDNPLNFEIRKHMVLAATERAYPRNNFTVIASLSRNTSYQIRSREFDARIKSMYPKRDIVVYGASDSFVDKYTGTLRVVRVEDIDFSKRATQLREEIAIRHTRDFRAGIIWAKQNQPAQGFPAVDVVIMDHQRNRVILVKKESEDGWRFPGTMFNPDMDESYEHAAKRTIKKEVPSVKTSLPSIMASKRIADWRLKRSKHWIVTVLCYAEHFAGSPKPGDGFSGARWFDKNALMDVLVDDHKPLAVLAEERGFH